MLMKYLLSVYDIHTVHHSVRVIHKVSKSVKMFFFHVNVILAYLLLFSVVNMININVIR